MEPTVYFVIPCYNAVSYTHLPQLAEQGLPQLLGGVDVKLVPHLSNNGLLKLLCLGFQLLAVGPDAVLVHVKADVLHLGQHKA